MTIDYIRTLVQPPSTLVLPDDNGSMGFSVALLYDEIRNHIIVGSPWKTHDYGGGPFWSGGVYIIDSNDGSLIQEILPTDPVDQDDWADFGIRIAQDGNWLVIISPKRNVLGHIDIGGVYFWEWTGATYVFRQRLTGNGAALSTDFGSSVGISGSLCVVGDRKTDISGTDSGTIHVFRESGGVWSEDVAAKTNAPTVQDFQYFGHAVDVDGQYIAVSANQFWGDHNDQGRAYIFKDAGLGNALILQDTLLATTIDAAHDIFGDSISLDNGYCGVGWQAYDQPGSPPTTNEGRIEIFKRSGVSWPHHQSLDLPENSIYTKANLGFGNHTSGSVSLSGLYLLGGARGWTAPPAPSGWRGAGFLWKRNTITDFYEPVLCTDSSYAIYPGALAEFGASVAVCSDGRIAIGGYAEWGDWASNHALPEGPPPAWSYLGTVRLYEIPPPPESPVASGFLVSSSALEEVSIEIEQYLTKMHPVTKRRLEGWKWDEVIWPGEDEDNNSDKEEEDF